MEEDKDRGGRGCGCLLVLRAEGASERLHFDTPHTSGTLTVEQALFSTLHSY